MADNATILRLQAKDQTGQAFRTAEAHIDAYYKHLKVVEQQTAKSARVMRQGFAQFGYQIQDIAVQLQGGQSPFIVLAQQGSQVASIFGAGGAVFGAVVAVGSIIGAALLPQLFGATTALEDLNEVSDETAKLFKALDSGTVILSDSFLKMAEASGVAATIELKRQRRELLAALQETQAEIMRQAGSFNTMISRASVQNDPLTAAYLAGLNEAPEQIAERFKNLYGVTEESMTRLQELSQKALGGTTSEIEAFLAALSEVQNQQGVTEEFNKLAESMSELFVASLEGSQQIANLEAAIADLDGFIAKSTEETDKSRESIEKMIESLQKQADTYGMGSTAIALYEARLAGATAEQQQQIAVLAGEVELRERAADALKAEEKAREDALKASQAARDVIKKEAMALADPIDQLNQQYLDRQEALRQALTTEGVMQTEHNALMVDLEKARIKAIADAEREAQDKQMQIMQARYQAAGQLAGAIAGVFSEGTAAQRAFLAVQKGLAVGEAIMNMHRAISSANAVPFPANLSAIAQAASTGLSAIAGIRAVSFEGGGFTGYGARAGGIDGRGGMPAIVHPNETIIDHTKGGGGVNVNITIQANDARGFDELLAKRRGMIASMVQASLNNVGRTI